MAQVVTAAFGDGVEQQMIVDTTATQSAETKTSTAKEPAPKGERMASEAQHRFIARLLAADGVDTNDTDSRNARLGQLVGRPIDSMDELTMNDAKMVIDTLKKD